MCWTRPTPRWREPRPARSVSCSTARSRRGSMNGRCRRIRSRAPATPTAAGSPEATVQQAPLAARTLVLAPATPAEDAVEMLGCLARAATPADVHILDQLRRGPPSPLRDRAVELGRRPPELVPR